MAIDTHPLSSGSPPITAAPSSIGRSSMAPSNIILLAAVGTMIGAAAILNFSPFGSLGRYQMIKGNEFGMVIRIDTVTGNLSRCAPSQRSLECEPWAAPKVFSTTFVPPTQPNQ